MKAFTFLQIVASTLIAGSLYSQVVSTKDVSSHGTVNIFLGNNNGLVAVTDSRISSGGRPVGYGQKLFQLDDHTICSIAGFFSDPGPTFGGQSAHPLETDIAPMFSTYIEYVWQRKSGSLAAKFNALAQSWALDLNVLEEVKEIAKQPSDPSESELTLAGYENGALLFGQIKLTPTVINGHWVYKSAPQSPVLEPVAGGKLKFKTAGIDNLAKLLLIDPAPNAKYDPIFEAYANSEKSGESPLSLDQLQTLANRIERMTADRFPQVVGGVPQIAVLSNGRATLFPPIVPFPPAQARRASVHVHSNETLFNITIKNNDPGTLLLFVNDVLHDCSIDLDRMIFANSTFYNCVFNYKGSPLVLFDGTNKISYSNLALSGNVSDNSEIVKMFKSEYPKVLVVHQSPKDSE